MHFAHESTSDASGEEELLEELSQLARMDIAVALADLFTRVKSSSAKFNALASGLVEFIDGSDGGAPGSCEHASAERIQNSWRVERWWGTTAVCQVRVACRGTKSMNLNADNLEVDLIRGDVVVYREFVSVDSEGTAIKDGLPVARVYDVSTGCFIIQSLITRYHNIERKKRTGREVPSTFLPLVKSINR